MSLTYCDCTPDLSNDDECATDSSFTDWVANLRTKVIAEWDYRDHVEASEKESNVSPRKVLSASNQAQNAKRQA